MSLPMFFDVGISSDDGLYRLLVSFNAKLMQKVQLCKFSLNFLFSIGSFSVLQCSPSLLPQCLQVGAVMLMVVPDNIDVRNIIKIILRDFCIFDTFFLI